MSCRTSPVSSRILGFVALAVILACLASPLCWAAEREPIYVSFFVHMQMSPIRGVETSQYKGEGPAPYSNIGKRMIEMCEKYGIKIEFAFLGICLQQLNEDYPEVIEKFKAMKMPITLYGGVGHAQPPPVGRERDLEGLSPEEQARAVWEAQTRSLVPAWHLEDGNFVLGNPRYQQPVKREDLRLYNLPDKDEAMLGGALAIEQILDVVPMQIFQPCFRGDESQGGEQEMGLEAQVLKALGRGSFEPSYNPGKPVTGGPSGAAFRPMGSLKTLQHLATILPKDRVFHFTLGRNEFTSELVEYLQAHPESFKIVWPDPEAKQWAPENRASVFLKKTYGADGPLQLIKLEPPLAKLAQRREREGATKSQEPRRHRAAGAPDFSQLPTRPLSKKDLLASVNNLLAQWPNPNHDGDFGGIPYYLEAGSQKLSLAEAFDAYVQAVTRYTDDRKLPDEISVRSLLGPIDYPQYELNAQPKLDQRKELGGYLPHEMEEEDFPSMDVVEEQGMPGDPERPWFPAVTLVGDVNVFDAAYEASKYITKEGAVPPGVTMWYSLDPNGKEHDTPHKVNPAEMLFAMAQLIQHLNQSSEPQPVMLMSLKVIPDLPERFVAPYSPVSFRNAPQFQSHRGRDGGFTWRGKVSQHTLNAVWTYRPEK